MDAHIALMVHQPERYFRNARGPFFDLDTVKLVHIEG